MALVLGGGSCASDLRLELGENGGSGRMQVRVYSQTNRALQFIGHEEHERRNLKMELRFQTRLNGRPKTGTTKEECVSMGRCELYWKIRNLWC